MRVQSFGDRRPDRIVWKDRQWQWASLRFEDGDFNTPTRLDSEAREKWFYQAIGASPAMFRRDTHAGSLYWLGLRDSSGALSGWRQDLQAHRAAARSRQAVLVGDGLRRGYPLADPDGAEQGGAAFAVRAEGPVGARRWTCTSGPRRPTAQEGRWIQTIPGQRLVRLLPHLRAGGAGLRRHAGSRATSKLSPAQRISTLTPRFEHGFDVHNRGHVDRLEVAHPDAQVFDGEDRDDVKSEVMS